VVGCNSLQFAPPFTDKTDKPERSEKQSALAKPSKYSLWMSPYIFYSDVELKRDQPLFVELATLRDQVCKELQLPGVNNIIEVYIFEDQERYKAFMKAKYPSLPARRAFFVAGEHRFGGTEDLLVYTFWGDRVRIDLRHELTHALLHSVIKDVPLWLDEGLAEYFELPPERKGVNAHHLDQIYRGEPFKPDLARLEQIREVEKMTQAEYREAWAWVHLMLSGKAEAKMVLLNYLQQLRTSANPGQLQPRLAQVYPSLEDALVEHLNRLDSHTRSTTVPASGVGVRFR
jgi:hypothetical protein